MYLLPCGDVVVVALEALGEVAGVEAAQARGNPRREVHAVGDVADVELVLEIARPHVAQNLLRDLAVEPRYAVDLLREVAGQHRHRELLVGVVGVGLAQVDVLLPRDAQHVGVVRHVLANHRLGEGVVTGRHGRMGRKERRGADDLQRLREAELLVVDQFADTLDADEGGVALVAVVDIVLDAQLAQGADTADAEQNLLLEAVLPVAAVEVVGNLAVLLEVGLVVRIEQVEVRAAHLALPDACRERAAREGDGHDDPAAVFVTHGRDGQLVEVLSLVGGLLRTLGRETLREVSVAVEQTYGRHRDVLVRGLLQVVAGQDAQTARVDFQRRVQTVLHREVGDARGACGRLLGHVGLELGVYRVEVGEEFGILLQLVEPLDAQLVEEGDGVALALVPEHGVNLLEEVACAGVPAPPEVARELLEGAQPLREGLVDHHAVPVGLLDEELLADEVDLLVLAAAVGGHGAVGALHGALDRLGIGALVGRVEVLPERRLRDFIGRRTHLLDPLLGELAEAHERIGDFALDLAGVEVVAADDLHAVVLLVRGDPESEAGQRRGDGRYGEGHRLERRIAPRLVVGGEYRDVHAHE